MSKKYMYTQPLADVVDYCMDCEYIEKYNDGKIVLGDIRDKCTRCKTGLNTGIYKADAIITALKLKKDIKNPYRGGRQSKIPESVRKAIKNQHNEGISIRKIAVNVGYDKNTINKILKE